MRARPQIFGADGRPYDASPALGVQRTLMSRPSAYSTGGIPQRKSRWLPPPALTAATLFDPNGRLVSSSQSGVWIESTIVGGAASLTLEAGTSWWWPLSAWDGLTRVGGNLIQVAMGLLMDTTEAMGASDDAWVAVAVADGNNPSTANYVASGIWATGGKWYAAMWIRTAAAGIGSGSVTRPDGGCYTDFNTFPGNVGGTLVTNWTATLLNSSGGLLDNRNNSSPPAFTNGNTLWAGYARGRTAATAGSLALRARIPLVLGDILTNCTVPSS